MLDREAVEAEVRHLARGELVAHRRLGLRPVHIVGLRAPSCAAARCAPVEEGGDAGGEDREADRAVDGCVGDGGGDDHRAGGDEQAGRAGMAGRREAVGAPASRRRKTNSAAPVRPNQMKSTETT